MLVPVWDQRKGEACPLRVVGWTHNSTNSFLRVAFNARFAQHKSSHSTRLLIQPAANLMFMDHRTPHTSLSHHQASLMAGQRAVRGSIHLLNRISGDRRVCTRAMSLPG